MKFFIISNLYEPYARGGAEGVVKTVAEGLVSRGHEVVVVTARPFLHFSPHGSMVQSMEPEKKSKKDSMVKILRFFPPNIYFVRNDWRHSFATRFVWRVIDSFNLPAAVMLWYALEREKPDVVLTHNLVGIGMLTSWIIRLKYFRSIQTLHDVQLIHPSGLLMWGAEERMEKSVARKIYEALMRVWLGSPSVVIAPSQWLLDFHTKRGFFRESKKIVLPNPISSASQFHGTVHGTGGDIRLLYAGQLEEHKGVKWLLEIMMSLRARRSNSKNHEIAALPNSFVPRHDVILHVAGAGSLERDVRTAAVMNSEHIIFHGKLSRDELFKKFAKVDALVVPSFCYENAPQIIAEALSVGLPVIASRIGGIPEFVREGIDGALFTPGNSEDFFAALKKLSAIKSESPPRIMDIDEYIKKLMEIIGQI